MGWFGKKTNSVSSSGSSSANSEKIDNAKAIEKLGYIQNDIMHRVDGRFLKTEDRIMAVKRVKDNLAEVVALHYDEAKIEEIVKKIVEQLRQDIVKMIQEQVDYNETEKEVATIIAELKRQLSMIQKPDENSGPVVVGGWNQKTVVELCSNLQHLLSKEINIDNIMQKMSEQVEALAKEVKEKKK